MQVHAGHVEATQRAPAFGLARPAGGWKGEPTYVCPCCHPLPFAPTCMPFTATDITNNSTSTSAGTNTNTNTNTSTNTTPLSPPPRFKAVSPFDAWVEALYSTIEAPEHAKVQQDVPLSGNDQVEDERNWNRHRECRLGTHPKPTTTAHHHHPP